MNIGKIFRSLIKWLRRFVIAFMLGFSNIIYQETKTIDDTFFKTEQVLPDKEE
ncbi:hypothetical protein [Dyadobacter sp. CY343]|uniref:hypothetical protein n=1 Tax=Dyadobacter sp. CY343 TaxID=2907299 RepID=UPI001F212B2E|nr:hypothetical protein [Dyadobacter sp. CY343]MCE7058690.1 hypothetical protein [Dyadobacter sp. CY343]